MADWFLNLKINFQLPKGEIKESSDMQIFVTFFNSYM